VDLTLDFAEIEVDRQPDVYYEVYLGLPAGATPEFKSPYYVGNLALFGVGVGDEHQQRPFRAANASFRITRAVQASLRREAANALAVLLVPRSAAADRKPIPAKATARIRIGSATISIRRQTREAPRETTPIS
jgi:hypothetical protein